MQQVCELVQLVKWRWADHLKNAPQPSLCLSVPWCPVSVLLRGLIDWLTEGDGEQKNKKKILRLKESAESALISTSTQQNCTSDDCSEHKQPTFFICQFASSVRPHLEQHQVIDLLTSVKARVRITVRHPGLLPWLLFLFIDSVNPEQNFLEPARRSRKQQGEKLVFIRNLGIFFMFSEALDILLSPFAMGGSKNPFCIDQRPSTEAFAVFQQSHVGHRVGRHFFPTNNLWAINWSIVWHKSAHMTDDTNWAELKWVKAALPHGLRSRIWLSQIYT